MNQIYAAVQHPIAEGTKVKALRPSCPCRGAKLEPVEGTVLKVISNAAGYWYYVDTGFTLKGEWIQHVL